MDRAIGALRLLLCALLLAGTGCQTAAGPGGQLPPEASLLAVDVRFPVPLGRDPTLVGVYLAKGPVHEGVEELPELVAASFVKGSRAYVLDPEPGTYSLVAVTSYFAPARRTHELGVSGTVSNHRDLGQVTVFPAELVRRTRTTVGPGLVAFMGVLEVAEGERVHAETRFHDRLQQRIAEAIRPEDVAATGLAARFTTTHLPVLEATSVGRRASDRDAFRSDARSDLAATAWAGRIPEPTGPVGDRREIASPVSPPVPPAPSAATPSEPPTPPSAATPEPSASATPTPEPSAPPSTAMASAPTLPAVPIASTSAPSATAVATPTGPAPSATASATPTGPAPTETPSVDVVPAESSTPPLEAEVTTAAVPPPLTLEDLDPAPYPALEPEEPARALRQPDPPLPKSSRLAHVLLGMSDGDVRELVGDPDDRATYRRNRAYIPFYTGADSHQVDWVYEGEGRVVFELDNRRGLLHVQEVVYNPEQR